MKFLGTGAVLGGLSIDYESMTYGQSSEALFWGTIFAAVGGLLTISALFIILMMKIEYGFILFTPITIVSAFALPLLITKGFSPAEVKEEISDVYGVEFATERSYDRVASGLKRVTHSSNRLSYTTEVTVWDSSGKPHVLPLEMFRNVDGNVELELSASFAEDEGLRSFPLSEETVDKLTSQ